MQNFSLVFSPSLCNKTIGKKAAYVAVMAALSVVSNMFLEIRVFDVQYSLTIFVSVIIGVVLGPIAGFVASFAGDFIGYCVNSWGQLYMPWVGISTAMLSFIAGIVYSFRKNPEKPALYLRFLIICALSFFICTIAINSTGFYFYNKTMGFSTAVLNYVSERFGGKVSYFSYVCYRLIFKMQIFNNIVNYCLLFAFLPAFKRVPLLKDFFR